MLCCGLIGLLAALSLGAWRLLRAHRRLLLGAAAALLAAGPVVAIAAAWPAETSTAQASLWAQAMRSICGGPTTPPRSNADHQGDRR